MTERDAGKWQQENTGVQLVKGIVTQVERREKVVRLSWGGGLRYDKFSNCTWGQPRIITRDNLRVLGIARMMVVGNGGIAIATDKIEQPTKNTLLTKVETRILQDQR